MCLRYVETYVPLILKYIIQKFIYK
ncbi:MAG: hypothetical protein ACLTK0_06935 [Anaerovoracaceae bacterium]